MTFDWQSLEDRLYEDSQTIIRQFAAEHPDVICSSFAYGTDPREGYFLLGFNSYAHSLQMAQEHEQQAIRQRNLRLLDERAWRTASSVFNTTRTSYSSPDISYFDYPEYARIDFPELVELSESENYPQPNYDFEDDYIEGNTRIVLWKVIERLIASHSFDQLHLASPFYVGYALHEDFQPPPLRILNWPEFT